MTDAGEEGEKPFRLLDDTASSGMSSTGVKNTSEASKKPPPESRHDIRVRTLVISSFWAIVILLGLPVWWWTTSIHRSRLPLQEMLEWADGKVSVVSGDQGTHRTADSTASIGLQTNLPVTDYSGRTVAVRDRGTASR